MKKKRFTMLAVMLLTIVSCMLMIGCGSGKARTESQMKRVAEKLLEEKYDEEFEIHYAWPRDSSLFYATCSPKSNPEIVFEMQAYNDGRGLYKDEYIQGIVNKQIEDKLYSDLQIFWENCFVKSSTFYNEINVEDATSITMQEYANQIEEGKCLVYVFINQESMKKDAVEEEYVYFSEILASEIAEKEIPDVTFSIYLLDEEQIDWCKEYFKIESQAKGEFSSKVGQNYSFGFGYKEGKINKSYEEYKERRMEMQINEREVIY